MQHTICSLATELDVEPATVDTIVYGLFHVALDPDDVFDDDPDRGGFVDRNYRDAAGFTCGDHVLTDAAVQAVRDHLAA
jgi:hypothetical protein